MNNTSSKKQQKQPPQVFYKKNVLKIFQDPLKNTSARVSLHFCKLHNRISPDHCFWNNCQFSVISFDWKYQFWKEILVGLRHNPRNIFNRDIIHSDKARRFASLTGDDGKSMKKKDFSFDGDSLQIAQVSQLSLSFFVAGQIIFFD